MKLVTQMVKCLPAMWESQVWSLGQEDPREKEVAPHSSTLAWKIPWMEEPGRLQSMGSQRVRHDWEISLLLFNLLLACTYVSSMWIKMWFCSLLDSVGESEGRMVRANGIETCMLSYVKWIDSPGSMHETRGSQGWCIGMTQRDGMGREVGGGSGWGHMYTCGGFMSKYGKTNTIL